MFDNIKFTVAYSNGNCETLELTALSLLSFFLCYMRLVNCDNAYDVLNWLAHTEPQQEYNLGDFKIIALDY